MKSKNFIPAHRLYARGRRRRLRGWALLCGGYMVVLAGGWLVCRGLWHDGQISVADQLDKASSRAGESRQEMAALQTTLSSAESTLIAKLALHDEPDWSKLLVLLVDGLDDEVVLTACQLTPPKPSQGTTGLGEPVTGKMTARPDDAVFVLRLAGYGRNQAVVSRFALQLEPTGTGNCSRDHRHHRRDCDPADEPRFGRCGQLGAQRQLGGIAERHRSVRGRACRQVPQAGNYRTPAHQVH